jgi:hypothetical protein
MSVFLVSLIWITGLFWPISAEPGSTAKIDALTIASTQTSQDRPIIFFVDRFGTVFFNRSPIKNDETILIVNAEKSTRKSIILKYDPISLEADRQRLFQKLRTAFPDSRIIFQTAEDDEYTPWLFPSHRPEVLERILSQQGSSAQLHNNGIEALIGQLEFYLTDFTAQSDRFHAELKSLEQKYQQLTTQDAGLEPQSK